jgi:tRNA(adenine34) deaminase
MTASPSPTKQKAIDNHFMELALDQARQAAASGEVPVGALLVLEGQVISAGANGPISRQDPTAHAEITVIREAARKLGNYRLPKGSTLYVTLEPCIMCMGAAIHARIDFLVFGALDPKTGAVESCYTIGRDHLLNHNLQVRGGVLADQCSLLLKSFFKERRTR